MGWRGSDGVVKGKRTVALERSKVAKLLIMLANIWFTKQVYFPALSFYLNHCDFTHPFSALDNENQYSHDLELDDGDIKHEDDWLEPEATVDAACKTSIKSLEATATEVSL